MHEFGIPQLLYSCNVFVPLWTIKKGVKYKATYTYTKTIYSYNYIQIVSTLTEFIEWVSNPYVEARWNVMAQAQKPDFVFRRNGRVHLNRRGASVQSTTGSWGVRISGSNAGYTMFRGSVEGTGYPLHSPVSPSLPLPSVAVCHHFNWSLLHLLSVCL